MLHAAKDGDSEKLLKCLNFPNSDINAVNKVSVFFPIRKI